MAAKQPIPPQQLGDNWARGMAGAGQAYTQGIDRYQGNPMAAAATPEALQKYQTACVDSVTSGRRANALNGSDPAAWRAQAKAYGPSGLATAGNKKKAKFVAAMGTWSQVYAQASAAAAAASDPLEKVRAAINTMKAAAGKPQI